MINWPKDYDEKRIAATAAKLPEDVLAKFEVAQAYKVWGFEYDDKIFIFKSIEAEEWRSCIVKLGDENLAMKEKGEEPTPERAEQRLNELMVELCVLYGKENLGHRPGLVLGIAGYIYRASGFDAFGTTINF